MEESNELTAKQFKHYLPQSFQKGVGLQCPTLYITLKQSHDHEILFILPRFYYILSTDSLLSISETLVSGTHWSLYSTIYLELKNCRVLNVVGQVISVQNLLPTKSIYIAIYMRNTWSRPLFVPHISNTYLEHSHCRIYEEHLEQAPFCAPRGEVEVMREPASTRDCSDQSWETLNYHWYYYHVFRTLKDHNKH